MYQNAWNESFKGTTLSQAHFLHCSPSQRSLRAVPAEGALSIPSCASRFDVVGYGCMTCIGNSGPLPEPVVEAITQVIPGACGLQNCGLFS